MKKAHNRLTFSDLRQIIVFGFDPNTKEDVYIDDCENGLSCGLVCRFCGNPLSAKNNCETKRNHFAHKAGSDCKKGHESTIPLLLVKILKEYKEIQLPVYRHPDDHSLIYEYKKKSISSIKLEKYEADLSFNVIVKTKEEMEIAIIPFVKSNDLLARKDDVMKSYNNVLVIDLEIFKASSLVIEDVIKEIVEGGCHKNTFFWISNEKESLFKEKHKLKLKRIEEERQRQLQEALEQRKRPLIIRGITYYHIEGVESFAASKEKIFIKNKEHGLMYLVDFTRQYKNDIGSLIGYPVDDNGVISDRIEIIRFQKDGWWTIH